MSDLVRLDFSFELGVLSDLHIGDGTTGEIERMRDRNDAPDALLVADYARVVRDHRGRPVIPATALKGALRKAYLHRFGDEAAKAAFGEAHRTEWFFEKGEEAARDLGGPAMLTFFAGLLDDRGSDFDEGLPRAPSPPDAGGIPTFVATHVSLSRRTGTADDQKLYNREFVSRGAVFRVEGTVAPGQDDPREFLRDVLGPLARGDGLSIGHGVSDGAGRVQILGTVKLTEVRLDGATGDVASTNAGSLEVSAAEEETAADIWSLALTCRGPYLSLDAAREGSNRGNVLRALRRNDDEPVLWPESLMGALRTEAAWISALECDGRDAEDDPFRKPASWMTPADLSPVERLFGVSGWRGLVRVGRLDCPAAARYPEVAGEDGWPGVEIDPISGGVRDQTLFFHDCFTGVRFDVVLALERRSARIAGAVQTYPAALDLQIWQRLKEELIRDGVQLGHGTSRGFGWFDAAEASSQGA